MLLKKLSIYYWPLTVPPSHPPNSNLSSSNLQTKNASVNRLPPFCFKTDAFSMIIDRLSLDTCKINTCFHAFHPFCQKKMFFLFKKKTDSCWVSVKPILFHNFQPFCFPHQTQIPNTTPTQTPTTTTTTTHCHEPPTTINTELLKRRRGRRDRRRQKHKNTVSFDFSHLFKWHPVFPTASHVSVNYVTQAPKKIMCSVMSVMHCKFILAGMEGFSTVLSTPGQMVLVAGTCVPIFFEQLNPPSRDQNIFFYQPCHKNSQKKKKRKGIRPKCNK